MVDGREVTTTSKKIVSGQEDAKKTAFAHQNRYIVREFNSVKRIAMSLVQKLVYFHI